MTTQNWLFPIQHTSDAFFRAWGSDLSAKLALVGLVQTADTGQIDWATAVRPTTGLPAYAGYEIWRYPDSTVYMKWEFGSAVNSNCPSIRVSVGTGSNGSGTLTGPVTAARSINTSVSALESPGANRQSLMCYVDGYFSFSGYINSIVAGTARTLFFFAVAPTVNANGVRTNEGVTLYYQQASANPAAIQAVNLLTSTVGAVSTTGEYALVPWGIASSISGTAAQAFVHWAVIPPVTVRPTMHMATVISSEFPLNTVFQTTLVGGVPRSYIALDTTVYGSSTGTTSYKLAMLWE